MRISDWSSDVCSSDLVTAASGLQVEQARTQCGADVGGAGHAFLDAGVERVVQEAVERASVPPAVHVALAELERAPGHQPRRQVRVVSSEERRGGKEWGSTCRSRWSPVHSKKKH